MNDSSARLNVTLDTSQPRQALEELGTLVQANRVGPLHGKPLFTIATLCMVVAGVLGAIAAAAVTLAGALPAGVPEQYGAAISIGSGITAAAALAAGGLGKALYALATAYQTTNLQALPEVQLLPELPPQPTVVQHIVVRPEPETSPETSTDAAPPRGD